MLATALLTLGLFLAYEFAYWLDHYLSHRVAFLWQFHRVHHAAESLSLLTNFRVHPIDTIVFANIVALVVGAVGGTLGWMFGRCDAALDDRRQQRADPGQRRAADAPPAFAFVDHLRAALGATVLSPAHHQVHHSADPRHFDRNFGNTLALFDRLFGTLHVPTEKREALRFGLDGAVAQPARLARGADHAVCRRGRAAALAQAADRTGRMNLFRRQRLFARSCAWRAHISA